MEVDVLFAGATSRTEHGASLLILRLGELTLIQAVTSEQVIIEAERNLATNIPGALSMFRLLVQCAQTVIPDPIPEEVAGHVNLADLKDISLSWSRYHRLNVRGL